MQRKEIVDIGAAYYALTLDVITDYAFGKWRECLELPDFSHEWEKGITAVLQIKSIAKYLPCFTSLWRRLPAAARKRLTLDAGIFISTSKANFHHQPVTRRCHISPREEFLSGFSQRKACWLQGNNVHATLTGSLPPTK